MQPPAQDRSGPVPSRTTAIAVGVLFLVAFVAYGVGSALVTSALDATANPMTLRIGATLMLLNSFVVGAIGVLMLAVVRPHSKSIALGHLGARLVEAVLLAVGVVFLLLQVPLSVEANDTAYQIAMVALGAGSVPLWYLAYRARLVPRPLALWGVVGYAVFLVGAVLEILGLEVGLILSVPGGLFEVVLAIWLIARGFSAPVTAPRAGRADASVAVAA